MPKYEVLATITVEYSVSVEVTAKNEDTAEEKAQAIFEQFDYRSTKSKIEVQDEQLSVEIDEAVEI